MTDDDILDCMKINTPEAVKPLSKAFGSMVYILCYHVFKSLPQNDSKDIDSAAEIFVDFMTDCIDKDSAKYMEHDSVENAIDTYLESCQWLVEHEVKGRKEILAHFLLLILPTKPLLKNLYYLNNLAIQIQEKNCLAFIIAPLKLSRAEVYQTVSGVDEALNLCFGGITEELDWKSKKNYLLRPTFISMLYPEILKSHFKAMPSGIAIIFDFDKINSLDEMSEYMKWVECFSSHEEYPSDLNDNRLFDYKSKKEALQAYTDASEELCRQCLQDAKAVFQHLVLMTITSTAGGEITAEDTPEQFTLIKDFARPLKLTEAEIKAVIDNQVKYMDEIIVPNAPLGSIS